MRRAVLTVTAAMVVSMLATGTAVAKQGGSSVTGDRAHGSGEFFASAGERFIFDARSDPSGGGATGFFRIERPTQLVFAGEVTCLQVVGNTATIAGVVNEVEPPFQTALGETYTFTVIDNGPNGAGDLISVITPSFASPACVPLPPSIPIENGDIVVQDATCERFKEHRDPDKSKCKDKT
jgi:hypothetical protein